MQLKKYFLLSLCIIICMAGVIRPLDVSASTTDDADFSIMASSILAHHTYSWGSSTVTSSFEFTNTASKVVVNSMKLQKYLSGSGSWSTVATVGPYNYYNVIDLDVSLSYQFTSGDYRVQTSITATISGTTYNETVYSPTKTK